MGYPGYYSLEKLLVRLSGDDDDHDDDDDDDDDDLSLLALISRTLLILGWVLVWLLICVATIECLRSPEHVAAGRERKEREIENLVELNKRLPQSARISIAGMFAGMFLGTR